MAKSRFDRHNRRRTNQRRGSSLRRIKTFLAWVLIVCFAAMGLLLTMAIAHFIRISRELPSVADITSFAPEESTRIYYADDDDKGNPRIMAILSAANRRPVKLDQISDHVRKATIAIEDIRFMRHHGVDYIGIVRAVVANVVGGNLQGQGASTITQQLARNIAYLGLSREKLLERKVREALLARRIEELFTKDEILELYLNTIYYGNGAYGIEAASQAYFHKSARRLSLSQAAYLVGLPQRPVYFSRHMEAALRRRDLVLDRMLEANYITRLQLEKARAETIRTRKAVVRGNQIRGAPYVVDYVVRQLIKLYGSDKARSGLRVFTSVDSRIQAAAEEALRSGVRRSGAANQGALICLENRTGWVRAMVGGVDYSRDQFNAVTQGRRQPGSAFKPIVYTAAIDTGKCDLDSTYRDAPDYPWRDWKPQNYGGHFSYGRVTVRNAIRRSLNSIAARVAYDAGIDTVISYARRMGIDSSLDRYLPLALGASAVKPIELCSAYTVFANKGRRAVPEVIVRVQERDGMPIDDFSPDLAETGIQPSTLEMMDEALRDVVLRGTATAASSVPDAHGKTGTTNDNRDAWFVGYTPELTTAVWVAREQRSQGRVRYLTMSGTTGGGVCAPIWRDFMSKALTLHRLGKTTENTRSDETTTRPPKPSTVTPDGVIPESLPEEPPPLDTPILSPEERLAPVEPGGPPAATPSVPSHSPQTTVPQPRPQPPPPKPDPGAEIIQVRVCAETGRLATLYCPVTTNRSVARRDIPRMCTTHRPPPGEGR